MTNNKPVRRSWFALLTPEVVDRAGGAAARAPEAHGSGGGFSVCTSSRQPPADDEIDTIARIR
jgi:hypothetical protein